MYYIVTILSLACTAAGFLATAVTFFVRFLKAVREKKTAQQIVKICDAIVPFIRQAETFVHYSGVEKKEFVLTRANQFAIEQKIPFNTGLVSAKIDELVRLSREVNARDKDIGARDAAIPAGCENSSRDAMGLQGFMVSQEPQKFIIGAR